MCTKILPESIRAPDAMELARPGYYKLVRAGITNEAEAERLARGTSGDAKHHLPRRL